MNSLRKDIPLWFEIGALRQPIPFCLLMKTFAAIAFAAKSADNVFLIDQLQNGNKKARQEPGTRNQEPTILAASFAFLMQFFCKHIPDIGPPTTQKHIMYRVIVNKYFQTQPPTVDHNCYLSTGLAALLRTHVLQGNQVL